MNAVDIYFSASVIFFFIVGLRWGILRMFVSIICINLAAYFAVNLAPSLVSAVSFFGAGNDDLTKAVLTGTILLVLVVLVEIILLVTKNIINIALLGPFDSIIGGIIGIVKGLIIAALVFDVILMFPISNDFKDAILKSSIRPIGERIVSFTFPIVSSAAPKVSDFVTGTVGPALSNMQLPSSEAIGVFAGNAAKTVENIVSTTEATASKNTLKRFTP